MGESLSNLVDKLAEGIHKTKCKYEHDKKEFKSFGIRYRDESAVLNTQTLKMI